MEALTVQLRTDRLLLRQFQADDIDAYAAMCADPEVMRYLSASGEPLSRADAWRQMAMFCGHWQLRGYGMWVAEELRSGAFVGRIGLHYPEGFPDRELGWAIAQPFWGQGLASEAARAAADHAFQVLGWDHLISLILPGNTRSIRVAERLGSRVAGRATVHGIEHVVYRLDAKMERATEQGDEADEALGGTRARHASRASVTVPPPAHEGRPGPRLNSLRAQGRLDP